jgi:hypothetical protein
MDENIGQSFLGESQKGVQNLEIDPSVLVRFLILKFKKKLKCEVKYFFTFIHKVKEGSFEIKAKNT